MALKYYLQVYGCQMNLYEAGLVRSILEQAGYQETENEFAAELLLMVTCSVRSHAEKRALGRLKQWIALRKQGSARAVGVLGCMAQALKEKLINDYSADLVIGPDRYQFLPELITAVLKNNLPQIATDFTNECYQNIVPKIKSGVTAFVTIMRGCSNFCSYCIVPYVKGGARSKPLPAILSEVSQLIEKGVKEITLLGQNVLAYNYQNIDFCSLLEKVCALPGIYRVRFLTSHPRDLTEQIIRKLTRIPKVCPQLHLPVQSGSNRILKLMNRGYTAEEYLAKVEMIRSYLPDISLTTDIIVGFPTETEEEFNATIHLIKTVQFDYAYMFKFSPRPGTAAAEIKPFVPPAIAQERLARLIEIQNQLTRQSNLSMLNREYQVLIENSSPRGNGSLGRTPQGKVVILDESLAPGYLVNVKINEIRGWTPKGRIIGTDSAADCNFSSQSVYPLDQNGGY